MLMLSFEIRLYKLFYYLECSCKVCLTLLSLAFILVLTLPVSTEIGTLEIFWNIQLKKINNENRKFEEQIVMLKQNQ